MFFNLEKIKYVAAALVVSSVRYLIHIILQWCNPSYGKIQISSSLSGRGFRRKRLVGQVTMTTVSFLTNFWRFLDFRLLKVALGRSFKCECVVAPDEERITIYRYQQVKNKMSLVRIPVNSVFPSPLFETGIKYYFFPSQAVPPRHVRAYVHVCAHVALAANPSRQTEERNAAQHA